MSLEEGLVAFLKNSPGVSALVGDRIYPVAAYGDGLPRVTYQRLDTSRLRALDIAPAVASVPRFQLACWGATYAEAKSLALAVRNANGGGGTSLDGFRGTWTYPGGSVFVQHARVEDDADLTDHPAHAENVGLPHVALDVVAFAND